MSKGYSFDIGISDENRQKVEGRIACIVGENEGYELVELKFFREFGKLNMTIYIWKKGGVDLKDCELIHKQISTVLDTMEDCFPAEYILNVSSMGLDRKIVSDDDYRRAVDTEIEFKCDGKKIHGNLISYDSEKIVLKTGDKVPKEIEFLRNNLTKVQPYIRF